VHWDTGVGYVDRGGGYVCCKKHKANVCSMDHAVVVPHNEAIFELVTKCYKVSFICREWNMSNWNRGIRAPEALDACIPDVQVVQFMYGKTQSDNLRRRRLRRID
jgi:hypothetical protein